MYKTTCNKNVPYFLDCIFENSQGPQKMKWYMITRGNKAQFYYFRPETFPKLRKIRSKYVVSMILAQTKSMEQSNCPP